MKNFEYQMEVNTDYWTDPKFKNFQSKFSNNPNHTNTVKEEPTKAEKKTVQLKVVRKPTELNKHGIEVACTGPRFHRTNPQQIVSTASQFIDSFYKYTSYESLPEVA